MALSSLHVLHGEPEFSYSGQATKVLWVFLPNAALLNATAYVIPHFFMHLKASPFGFNYQRRGLTVIRSLITLAVVISMILWSMFMPAYSSTVSVDALSQETFDLTELKAEFAQAQEIPLTQSWLAELTPLFQPTVVRVAWRPEALWLLARLEDEDMGSRSSGYNQRLWELGDAFEVFIRFDEADEYYEFHVSPNAHVMQLRFGVDLTPVERRQQLPHLFMPEQVIEPRVWIEHDHWYALLVIPASVVKPLGEFAAGDKLSFSFSRYDYSEGQEEPTLSSSSQHTELNFHNYADWGTLLLK